MDAARDMTTYTSTQEQNWLVLAAEALAEHQTLATFAVDGKPVEGAYYRQWRENALGRSLASIANSGQSPARVVITVSGAPIEPAPAASQGYQVERSFYKLNGDKVDIAQITQNERVVVALKITEAEARYARLLVVDRLPAGLRSTIPRCLTAARSTR